MRAERYTTSERTLIEVYGGATKIDAKLSNLSVTGARLECGQSAQTLSIGDLIALTVVLPDLNKEYKISAEVIWTDEASTGVNFLNSEALYQKFVARTNARRN